MAGPWPSSSPVDFTAKAAENGTNFAQEQVNVKTGCGQISREKWESNRPLSFIDNSFVIELFLFDFFYFSKAIND